MKTQQGKVRILSKSGEPFRDRIEAGRLLAAELKEYSGKKAVVLGIPRGGVIIAEQIAKEISADMDIVLTHKLGAPYNCELAVGAVCEDGTHFVNESIAGYVGADRKYIEQEKKHQINEISRKVGLYRPVLARMPLKDRIVIITDDGVATGATMQAAIWAIRKEEPAKIVLAVPVGPPDSIKRLSGDADQTVCLKTPYDFQALGRFYIDFPQVEDEELLAILKEESKRRTAQ
jgi:predicted phosphoribosyltransferase